MASPIEATYDQAVQFHRAGDLQAAQKLYMDVLRQDPNHADAMCRCGVLASQVGRIDVALQMIPKAIELRPDIVEFQIDHGNVLSLAGRYQEAADVFRQAHEKFPGNKSVLNNYANALRDLGRGDEAMAIYEQSLAENPDDPLMLNNMGNALEDQGKTDDAIACYVQAIDLAPDFAEAHHNLAAAQAKLDHVDEAIELYRKAVELRPNLAASWQNLGVLLMRAGRSEESLDALRHLLKLRPDLAEGHNDLGIVLSRLGRLDEAISSYNTAIAIHPAYPPAYHNLGHALNQKGDTEGAIAAYRRAIELHPDFAEAINSLGVALSHKGDFDECIRLYTRAMELEPAAVWMYDVNLGHAHFEIGQLDEAIAKYRHSIGLRPQEPVAIQNLLFTSHYMPQFNAADIHREHASWVARHADPLHGGILPYDNEATPDRKLKIGYVSPDFCRHPIAFFIEPIFANHDREKFETHAYSSVGREDDVTRRLRGLVDQWHDVRVMSDEALADRIRRDRIDILVDLSLHMSHNRMLVFARKPAPVQVTYLGYPASTGLPTMDYRITDHYLDPPKTGERYDIEQLVRLPKTYFCYQPPADVPEIDPLPATKRKYVTFASLNTLAKVNPQVMAAWAQILTAAPKSRLMMRARGLGSEATRRRIEEFFVAQGIAADRLDLEGWSDFPEFMADLNDADVALDTFPFNGGTTTCHALWMGLPVISLAGTRAVSRMGLSILSNVGLAELAVTTTRQYVDLAVRFAEHFDRIEPIRTSLRERMLNSPLTDGRQFAADLESAYRRMWVQWCRG